MTLQGKAFCGAYRAEMKLVIDTRVDSVCLSYSIDVSQFGYLGKGGCSNLGEGGR